MGNSPTKSQILSLKSLRIKLSQADHIIIVSNGSTVKGVRVLGC